MGPLTRLRRRLGPAAVVGLLGTLAMVAPVSAADAVTFGEPTANSTFGKLIEFKQPVDIVGVPQRVDLLLTTPGSLATTVIPISENEGGGSAVLDYRLDLGDGHIVPNTTFTARWRVTDGAGKVWVGPAVRRTYADDRFTWKSLEGDVVHVHWIEGDQAFGRRALTIGDEAVAEIAKLLGVTESDPIDFFIYADEATFRAALGPATRESVGGQAHPDIRTLFALIVPADIDASWVESVVPHELAHVVFATAVDNPYHDPPRWLNEGLAVYLSDGYDDDNRSQVERAAANGSIIPLDGLAGAFPTTRDRFFLAYAESVSAVDRIVRVNGRDALVNLIRSYRDGVSDDAAFQTALGRDVAQFEADWLGELGATPPTRLGPKPAPVGPLPSGWEGPQPNPSFEVVGSAPPVAPGAPRSPAAPDDPLARFLMPSLSALGLVLLVVLVAVGLRRMRRRTDPATWGETGDNRLFGRPVTDEQLDPASTASGEPSRLWTTTEWSLPRDPDDQSGQPGDAAPDAPAEPPPSDAPADLPATDLPEPRPDTGTTPEGR